MFLIRALKGNWSFTLSIVQLLILNHLISDKDILSFILRATVTFIGFYGARLIVVSFVFSFLVHLASGVWSAGCLFMNEYRESVCLALTPRDPGSRMILKMILTNSGWWRWQRGSQRTAAIRHIVNTIKINGKKVILVNRLMPKSDKRVYWKSSTYVTPTDLNSCSNQWPDRYLFVFCFSNISWTAGQCKETKLERVAI